MNRRVAGLLAVAVLALGPALAAAPAYAAPEGQITWAVHFTIAPVWFDPGEHTQGITPLFTYYSLHDALVKPMPGKSMTPSLAESAGTRDRPQEARGVAPPDPEDRVHVDLKFLSTDELLHRVEDPTILWDRHGALRSALSTAKAEYPQPRVQWIEDRFWFLRARVLGPLVLFQAGVRPNGVRRVEQSVPARVPPLRSTLALHDRESCRNALVATVALYTDLREQLASPTLVRRTDAERAARSFLS